MTSDEGIMCPMCGSWPVPVVISQRLADGPGTRRRFPDAWNDEPVSEACCKRPDCKFRFILPKEA